MIEPRSEGLAFAPDFGLNAAPFADCVDDSWFFPSDQHLRALEFLGAALWTRARLGVVTADAGCGKSLLIRRLLRDLDERIVVASVQRDQMSARDFLLEILQQFGFPLEDNDKSDRRKLLERFLTHQATTGRLYVVIVENPQSMSPAVLEEVRSLASLEGEHGRILKLLLIGQPSLNLVLQSPRMAELGAARAPRFALGAFSEDQTAAYVAHRLRAAGATNPDALMPSSLMAQIHACSGGVARQINRLCECALALTAEAGALHVAAGALDRAIEELQLTHRKRAPAPPLPRQAPVSESAGQTEGRLVISMQGLPDREVVLSADRLLVGRGEEADIRIDSVFVSRYHAFIVRHAGQDLLIDLGSTNGVLVNSRRIARRALRHRDLIQVGPVRVMYFNERLAEDAQPDPGETICFARPGFPPAAGQDDSATLLAFARLDDASSS